MLDWALWNRDLLARYQLWATQRTGELVRDALGVKVNLLLPGPEGGDAQVAAMIARRQLDLVVFLWDPLVTQPHDSDVRSLIRLAVVHNIPIACNRRSADLIITSPLLETVPAA